MDAELRGVPKRRVPVFALFIYLLHRKKRLRYVGTLIFSVHFHCFAFLILLLCMLVNRIAGISELFYVTLVIFPIYLFLACRHVYNNSRSMTLLKTLVIGLLHAGSMATLFLVTTFISLLVF